jgi:hypothetical protein
MLIVRYWNNNLFVLIVYKIGLWWMRKDHFLLMIGKDISRLLAFIEDNYMKTILYEDSYMRQLWQLIFALFILFIVYSFCLYLCSVGSRTDVQCTIKLLHNKSFGFHDKSTQWYILLWPNVSIMIWIDSKQEQCKHVFNSFSFMFIYFFFQMMTTNERWILQKRWTFTVMNMYYCCGYDFYLYFFFLFYHKKMAICNFNDLQCA